MNAFKFSTFGVFSLSFSGANFRKMNSNTTSTSEQQQMAGQLLAEQTIYDTEEEQKRETWGIKTKQREH